MGLARFAGAAFIGLSVAVIVFAVAFFFGRTQVLFAKETTIGAAKLPYLTDAFLVRNLADTSTIDGIVIDFTVAIVILPITDLGEGGMFVFASRPLFILTALGSCAACSLAAIRALGQNTAFGGGIAGAFVAALTRAAFVDRAVAVIIKVVAFFFARKNSPLTRAPLSFGTGLITKLADPDATSVGRSVVAILFGAIAAGFGQFFAVAFAATLFVCAVVGFAGDTAAAINAAERAQGATVNMFTTEPVAEIRIGADTGEDGKEKQWTIASKQGSRRWVQSHAHWR